MTTRIELIVELTVDTNIESNSLLRYLLREGLQGLYVTDIEHKEIRSIEIIAIGAINHKEST